MMEAQVREVVRAAVLRSSPSSKAVYEFWVPRTNERADVAVLGTTIEAFEIKTERDTLTRLPRQVEAYTRVFDRCSAVVAVRHVDKVLQIVPSWWGVEVIASGMNLATLRPAENNDRVDAETLVRLLWRDEAYAALQRLGTPADPCAGRFRLWEMLLIALDIDALRAVVRMALHQRDPSQARIPSKRFRDQVSAAS